MRPTMASAANRTDGSQEAKYYLIFLHSIPERQLSREVVDLHAAHLAELDNRGKLVMAGALLGGGGGVFLLRVESAAEAKAIAEEDPLVRGAYQTYELATWLMSNRQNGYRPNIQPGS